MKVGREKEERDLGGGGEREREPPNRRGWAGRNWEDLEGRMKRIYIEREGDEG